MSEIQRVVQMLDGYINEYDHHCQFGNDKEAKEVMELMLEALNELRNEKKVNVVWVH